MIAKGGVSATAPSVATILGRSKNSAFRGSSVDCGVWQSGTLIRVRPLRVGRENADSIEDHVVSYVIDNEQSIYPAWRSVRCS